MGGTPHVLEVGLFLVISTCPGLWPMLLQGANSLP